MTDKLLRICRRIVDTDARPVAVHSGHNNCHVLRARTKHGDVIVKAHRSKERHDRELNAYRRWVPALGEHAPRLVAHLDDPPAIVVTALAGTVLAELDLSPDDERDASARAGSLLRALHDAEPPRTDINMAAWLAHRGEQWLTLAREILTSRQRTQTRSHLLTLATLGPLPTTPCHLDFMPRNLVRAADGFLWVIDFEHARYDLPARDLVRLDRRVWQLRPDLRAAFLDTYGSLSDLDREVIEHCGHLDLLTAAVRASGRNLAVDSPSQQSSPPRI